MTPKNKPVGGGALNKAKTHCINGHPYSPKNTHVSLAGKRMCITCRKVHNVKGKETQRRKKLEQARYDEI